MTKRPGSSPGAHIQLQTLDFQDLSIRYDPQTQRHGKQRRFQYQRPSTLYARSFWATHTSFQKTRGGHLSQACKSHKTTAVVHPKDPTPMEKKCGVVYKIQCRDREEVYIGETARPFGVRFREHVNSTRSSTTAVGDHLRNTRYALDLSSLSGSWNDTFKTRIREAIEIHCQAPTWP